MEDSMCKHIGRKFGNLTVISDGQKRKQNSGRVAHYLLCRCNCGVEKQINLADLNKGDTISCGCVHKQVMSTVRKDLTGQKFGLLTVVSRNLEPHSYYAVFYNAICECGRKSVVSSSNLKNGRHTSCGECKLYRNGRLTSNAALKLNNMIPDGLHNYYTDVPSAKKGLINVDIALPDEKIAIEYDCLYWHEKQKDKDKQKTELLVNGGWKVLRISSMYKLPSQQELNQLLNTLRTTDLKVLLITL